MWTRCSSSIHHDRHAVNTDPAEGIRVFSLRHAEAIRAARCCGQPRCPCTRSGPRGVTHCPAHEDEAPRLVVDVRRGSLVLECLAGCLREEILDALGRLGLWPDP